MTPAAPDSRSARIRRARRRRRARRIDFALSLLLAVALFLLLALLSSRHFFRYALSTAPDRPLSAKTLLLLDTIPDRIRLSVLLRPTHPAAAPLRHLLNRLQAAAPGLDVAWCDPDADPAAAEHALSLLPPSGAVGECLVLAIGPRAARIDAADLLDVAPSPATPSAPAPVFRGEARIVSALESLLRPDPPLVCFLQGHGERSPLDFSRAGCSRVASLLREANCEVDVLSFASGNTVPNRCALLVLAGPTHPLSPAEQGLLRDYLSRKGRLLLLLDALRPSGLDNLLRDWAVLLDDHDVVLDPPHSLNGRDILAAPSPDHPLSAPLAASQVALSLPRSVRPAPSASSAPDKPAVLPLLWSSDTSWSDLHPEDDLPSFNPLVDLPGPVPLAVAVERGPLPGVHAQIRPTRLVVVGDSDFIADASLHSANAAFFLRAVDWLLDRPLPDSPSLPLPDRPTLPLSSADLTRLALLLLLVLPLAAAALPTLYLLLRRRS